jgi:serine/threonine-protein kinase
MSRAARRRTPGLSPGTTIAGRYRLEARLGEGGMAEVFRAEDLASGRRVAVKVLHRDVASNPEAVERTKREGQVLSELDNPAIVSVETFGELEDGTVFLVMELLEGETLGARMRRGPLDPAELAPIVAGTCAGLHAAHSRGIVHRDLKPDNIFLCPTAHGLQVKLLDFGISKVYGSEKLTQTGEILGTPRYMSPEQLGAESDIDARVDVYALGVILYEALAAKPPFLASTPTDLIIAILNGKVAPLRTARPDLSADVEAVVMRALSKVRTARYDTAMALAEAYIDAVGGPSAVRSEQRRGMATRAFGGMLQAPTSPPSDAVPDTRPPPASPEADAVAGPLRIGTFSGVGAAAEASAEPGAPPPGAKRTAQMGASPGAAIPQTPGAPVPGRMVPEPLAPAPQNEAPDAPEPAERPIPGTRSPEEPPARPMPATRASPAGMGDAPDAGGAPPAKRRRVAPTAVMDDAPSAPAIPAPAPSPRRARRGGGGLSKVLLVVGALLAGAASAGAVIGVLHLLETDEDAGADVSAPAEPAPEAPEEVTAPAEAPEAEGGEAAAPSEEDAASDDGASDEPAGEAAREDLEEREEREERASAASDEPRRRSPTRRRARRRRRSGAPSEGRGDRRAAADPGPDEVPDDPIAALRVARRALRAGDPERCVSILNEAIRDGAPAIALRRRADCYEAAGRRRDAVNDYQRFCRLVPDHPSVSEVRPLLEGWGRSCP